MGISTDKHWFRCSMKGSMGGFYLIAAYSFEEADRRLGNRDDNNDLVELNWFEVKQLTGCAIPSACKPSDIAAGDLMFDQTDKITFLYVGD